MFCLLVHCVVFYDVSPLTGQVLGKVLLTSRENEPTIDGDFQNKQFIQVPKFINTLSSVTGLPGPVIRIHKYYKLI